MRLQRSKTTTGWDAGWRNSCIGDRHDAWLWAGWIVFITAWYLVGHALLPWLMLFGVGGGAVSGGVPIASITENGGRVISCEAYREKQNEGLAAAQMQTVPRCTELWVGAEGELAIETEAGPVVLRGEIPSRDAMTGLQEVLIVRPHPSATLQYVVQALDLGATWAAAPSTDRVVLLGASVREGAGGA